MKIRTISGACYTALCVLFFICRQYVCSAIFDIFLMFLLSYGTFEVARAVKKYIVKYTFYIAIVFGIIFPLVYILLDYLCSQTIALIVAGGILCFTIIVLLILKIVLKNKWTSVLISILPILYPSLGLLCAFLINDFSGEKGLIGLLLVFVVPAISDSTAYIVGSNYNKLKKGNAKRLCPEISPNKTWAGAIGALIGGIIAGILVYVIFKPTVNVPIPLFVFAFIGGVASIVNMFGDLFESYIKRRVGIKDMGRIMPGHGGVMDRIDGLTFTAIYVFVVLLFI